MRGSPTRRRHRPRRTLVTSAASAALLLPLLGAAPPADGARAPSTRLQDAFDAAAAEYRVPRSVLLGVSYLQSRWDTHGGAPSVAGGYGPMHLTDARTALAQASHHGHKGEDPRGDGSRGARHATRGLPDESRLPARLRTLRRAADLTGLPARTLRENPAANIRGGAALLADAQRRLRAPFSTDPAAWYTAVARFSGAEDTATASAYADDVFRVIGSGTHRTTDAGQRVALPARPALRPDRSRIARAGLRASSAAGTECPATVSCRWVPAAYKAFGDGDYGNHDLGNRPVTQKIEYIVVHDIEGYYDSAIEMLEDPAYVSWNYTLRATDGQISQHVKAKDVAWHAGNWYINSKSVGLEHEGFLTSPDAWYTEAMYQASARLVAFLAAQHGIPLDRRHIIGHDNVPGTVTSKIRGMHTDPGPYWDWKHYFELLGAPFEATAGPEGGLVTVLPDYATNRPRFTGCGGATCAAHGSSAVRLYSRPDETSTLIRDIGLNPDGSASTTGVNDLGSRVSTGQQFAVAERQGDWTAIWFLGQKAWFRNPADRPTAVDAVGTVITPRAGLSEIPVYGRAYPEAAAYPAGVPVQEVSPWPYRILAGQRYVSGGKVAGEYFYAPTFDTAPHRVVIGADQYYEIQFGHRVAYVRAADVQELTSS